MYNYFNNFSNVIYVTCILKLTQKNLKYYILNKEPNKH